VLCSIEGDYQASLYPDFHDELELLQAHLSARASR
jgi:hypothetical protein